MQYYEDPTIEPYLKYTYLFGRLLGDALFVYPAVKAAHKHAGINIFRVSSFCFIIMTLHNRSAINVYSELTNTLVPSSY